MKTIWRVVGYRNGRPIRFAYRVWPGAREVAAKLDKAFPWDETREGLRYWLKVYDRLMVMAGA
jgi:hypothetical protein